MKILHVNTFDVRGGAARAAYRLHTALLDYGIDSSMLVQVKESDDITVNKINNGTIHELFAMLRPRFDNLIIRKNRKEMHSLFSPAIIPSYSLVKRILDINPDIVHLHWISKGMLRIEEIKKIQIPIVWSLHDNWAFTGGCHVMHDCKKYLETCGYCPVIGSSKKNDISRWIWKRKHKAYFNIPNLHILGLSKWINNCSQKSSLLKKYQHTNLPNLIETSIYKPIDRKFARTLLNLPLDKKLIIFGAVDPLGDANKGFKILKEALSGVEQKDNIALVVYGKNDKNILNSGIKHIFMGMISDDTTLVAIYNSADVIVVPSLQENLSNTIMESMSCSTPVVAFNVGGNSDLIEHKSNGYLAIPRDAKDLLFGIKWILQNPNYRLIKENARKKILNCFQKDLVVKDYIRYYEKVIKAL